MSESIELGGIALEVNKGFELIDDVPQLRQETYDGLRDKLLTTAPAEREAVATQLVAMANKFIRVAGEATAMAVAQLFMLVAELLEDTGKAKQAFAQGGVEMSGAAKTLLDRETSSKPVEGSVASGNSLWALRTGKK